MGNFSNYWDLHTLFTKLKNKLKSISDKIDDSVSLKTATGNPITLTDAANANAEKLLMTIEPIQSGSGDPSPDNVRPISGISTASVQTTDGTDTNTATITLGQTVYGGSVNFKTGEVTVTHGMVDLGDYDYGIAEGLFTMLHRDISDAKTPTAQGIESAFCSAYKHYYTGEGISLSEIPDKSFVLCVQTMSFSRKIVVIKDSSYTDAAAFKTAMSGVQLCYELATPVTLTLTPAELELLKGNNTITANGAEISIEYYPDNAIGALAGRVDDKADKPTSTANGGLIPLWNLANGKLNYYSDGAKQFGVTIESGNPKLRSQSSSSTYANFSASGYEHISGHSLIRVTSPDGIVGSGNGGYNFDLTREKLSYLNNITSDVQAQINAKVEIQNNAGFHNSIYRGKYLGSEVTAEQYAAIANGTFDDMYIGDYWTIGGVNYRIAAFDYWLHCGDRECTTHHVVLVPDTNLDSQKMNDSNVTTGGYVGSKMYTSYITTARNKVISAFGSANILSHRQLFSNAVDGNYASNWAWYDSTIDLMSESMVYGAPIGGKAKVDSINFNIGIDKVQLPLFALDPSRITIRANWWLRDAVSSAVFAFVALDGVAYSYNARTALGVRPAFGIKA